MLQVNNLVVRYGGITAVDGISLQIDQHETVALIGANGAGKTTTLHAISGLLKAAGGQILFQGEDITKTPAEPSSPAVSFRFRRAVRFSPN